MEKIILNTTHWKKYLDWTNNKRVENFLKSRGDDVLWQISQNIHKSGSNPKWLKDKLVMLVHENAPNAILIEKNEYQEVLDLAIEWFSKKEQYEKCAQILKFKNDIINFKSTKTQQEPIKNLI
jgi:hypothetical protein